MMAHSCLPGTGSRQQAVDSLGVTWVRSSTGSGDLHEGCQETPLPNRLEGETPNMAEGGNEKGKVSHTQPRAQLCSPGSWGTVEGVGGGAGAGKGGHHSSNLYM